MDEKTRGSTQTPNVEGAADVAPAVDENELLSQINQYIALSFCTFFCCSLFSILPIVLSFQAKAEYKKRSFVTAQNKIRLVRNILLAMIVLWGVYIVFSMGLMVLLTILEA